MAPPLVLDVLVEECEAIAALIRQVPVDEGGRPTNCPPWTLKELVVHMWGTVRIPQTWAPADGPVRTTADYYRRAERETDEYRTANVHRASRAAARFDDLHHAAKAMVRSAREARDGHAGMDPGQIVAAPNSLTMRLGDYLATRVVSIAIHGIDAAISLGVDPPTTAAAEAITVGVLEDLLGATAASLGWWAQDLIVWTTGRAPLPAAQRPALGPRAALLPLIS